MPAKTEKTRLLGSDAKKKDNTDLPTLTVRNSSIQDHTDEEITTVDESTSNQSPSNPPSKKARIKAICTTGVKKTNKASYEIFSGYVPAAFLGLTFGFMPDSLSALKASANTIGLNVLINPFTAVVFNNGVGHFINNLITEKPGYFPAYFSDLGNGNKAIGISKLFLGKIIPGFAAVSTLHFAMGGVHSLIGDDILDDNSTQVLALYFYITNPALREFFMGLTGYLIYHGITAFTELFKTCQVDRKELIAQFKREEPDFLSIRGVIQAGFATFEPLMTTGAVYSILKFYEQDIFADHFLYPAAAFTASLLRHSWRFSFSDTTLDNLIQKEAKSAIKPEEMPLIINEEKSIEATPKVTNRDRALYVSKQGMGAATALGVVAALLVLFDYLNRELHPQYENKTPPLSQMISLWFLAIATGHLVKKLFESGWNKASHAKLFQPANKDFPAAIKAPTLRQSRSSEE